MFSFNGDKSIRRMRINYAENVQRLWSLVSGSDGWPDSQPSNL